MLSRVVPGSSTRNDPFLAEQPIDERRLAHVGSADDRNANALIHGRGRLARRESVEHLLHQRPDTLFVGRRDADRLAEREGVKFCRHERGIAALTLVDGQCHRLAAAAQALRDVLVSCRQSFFRIHDQHHAIGLADCAQALLGHLCFEAAGILDEAASIDDDVRERADLAEAVLAIARQARLVCNQRIARAGKHVEQRRLADIGSTDECDDG